MSEIQMLTRIRIQATKEELIRALPGTRTTTTVILSTKKSATAAEFIHISSSVRTLLDFLEGVEGLRIEESKNKVIEPHYISIDHCSYQVFEKSDSTSIVEVHSYYIEDEARHYTKVDTVKDAISGKGFTILDGECEITITRRC